MLTVLKLLVLMAFGAYSDSVQVEHAHAVELEAIEAEVQIQEALQNLEEEVGEAPAVEALPEVEDK